MSEGKHCEIERKFLIAMPDSDFLKSQPGCAVWEIEQIYLTALPGETRRIRCVTEASETRYYKTFKRRLTALTAEEDEGQISRADYEAYRNEADPDRHPILKTRCRIPFQNQILEVDLYPFWADRAILEIELNSESQPVHIPTWLHVLKEVTDDHRYKNVSLAQTIPNDPL